MTAQSNLPIFPQYIKTYSTSLVNANGVNTVALVAANNNGTQLNSLTATSNNTTDLAVNLWINNGGADTLIASIEVPANSGNNSNPAIATVDLLRGGQLPGLANDANGNKIISLQLGSTLKVSANSAVAVGKVLNIFGYGGDF